MARIEARIDGTIKSKAKDVLANHGLTISDFMRMTLTTVAHDGLPKYYSIPNRQLKNSIQEVIDDLSGKEKLPEARNLKELDQLLSSDDALESSKSGAKTPSGVQYLKVHYLKSLMIKSGVLGNILFSV